GRRAHAAPRAGIVDAQGARRAGASALRRSAPTAAGRRGSRRHTSAVVARIAAAAERSDAGLAVAWREALRGARLDGAPRGSVRVRPAAGDVTRPAAGRPRGTARDGTPTAPVDERCVRLLPRAADVVLVAGDAAGAVPRDREAGAGDVL